MKGKEKRSERRRLAHSLRLESESDWTDEMEDGVGDGMGWDGCVGRFERHTRTHIHTHTHCR